MLIYTKEAQRLNDDFNEAYGNNCCSCHIRPPCGYCTHPGNPNNLSEDDGNFVDDLVYRTKERSNSAPDTL